jgi:hypothetical protein
VGRLTVARRPTGTTTCPSDRSAAMSGVPGGIIRCR